MPYIIESGNKVTGDLSGLRENFNYKYTNDLDLRPQSKLHKEVVDKIMGRARASANVISKRHSYWRQLDRTLTTYIDLSESDKKTKEKDSAAPVSIVFPYSNAILESMLSYMCSAFLQEPLFEFEAADPTHEIGSILMELLIDQQCWKSKVPLALHTMFRDSFVYGFGAVAPKWETKREYRTRVEPVYSSFYQLLGVQKQISEKTVRRKETVFEGNSLTNIDPYKCLPDPEVPIYELQKGEFFGWISEEKSLHILKEEAGSDGDVFNAKYLKSISNKKTAIFPLDPSDREKRFGGKQRATGTEFDNTCDIINMFVDIVPYEWKLGKHRTPEKWYFRVVGDCLLIEARPVGLDHDMFPAAAIAPEYDGYSTSPISRIETLYGMQGIIDFLFNSHVANVRKAVNDMFLVDPYLVNMDDFDDPGPGRRVRLRKPAWGRGVQHAAEQLQVNDVTRQNIGEISFIVEYMNKIGASDDASMGALRKSGPERITSKEFQGTRAGAFTRMSRLAQIIGMQGMQDIGHMFAMHTQQLMSKETFVKAGGDRVEALINEYGIMPGQYIPVSPKNLYIDCFTKVRDGSIPGGNYSETWERLFKDIATDPELRQTFDIVRIFKYIARNKGAKNVNQFVKIKTASTEQVATQAQAGNLVPLEEMMQ